MGYRGGRGMTGRETMRVQEVSHLRDRGGVSVCQGGRRCERPVGGEVWKGTEGANRGLACVLYSSYYTLATIL